MAQTPVDPARLGQLVTAGDIQSGPFARTPHRINGRDYDYRTPLGAAQGPWARHFHYKQFQYFGVLSDQVLAGCALAHTGYLGLAFVYVYDTASGRMTSETVRLPLAHGLHLSESPVNGDSLCTARGTEIRMAYREAADGSLEKSLRVRTARGIVIDAAVAETSAFQPLALCTRTGINGWTFANKVAGLPVSGRIVTPDAVYDLPALGACGHHDFSAGYMRRETFWNWACLSGRVRQPGGDRLLGLNLSCGVNETSFSENCLWIDGQLVPTGLARFDYDRRDTRRPWRIRTADHSVDLTFTPAGAHTERMNLLLFATDFKQLFGRFEGSVRIDGAFVPVDGLWGFVEEQYAKW